MALVLALYLLLCVRVTADICAGAAKGQIVFSADVGALAFHAQVSGWVKGRRIQMRFPLPKFKTKSDKKEFRRRWLIARAVLHAADWELIALHVRQTYLLLTGQAICTEAAARGIRGEADAKQRRKQALSDLMAIQKDVQKAASSPKEPEEEEDDLFPALSQTRRISVVKPLEEAKPAAHRRRKQAVFTVIQSDKQVQ